jgi:hypothetical protein
MSVLALAVVLLQEKDGLDPGGLKPLVLHTASLMLPARAGRLLQSLRAEVMAKANLVKDIIAANDESMVETALSCLHGSAIVDKEDNGLLRGSYRLILDKTVAVVAIASVDENEFDTFQVLKETEEGINLIVDTIGSTRRDTKLTMHARLEKLHAHLYMATRRTLLRLPPFLTYPVHGIPDLTTSTQITSTKPVAQGVAESDISLFDSLPHVDQWKTDVVNPHGDDPANDVFQFTASTHFSKILKKRKEQSEDLSVHST